MAGHGRVTRAGAVATAASLLTGIAAMLSALGAVAAEGATDTPRTLFADYRTQLAAMRDEAGYETFVLAKGERLPALIERAGFSKRDARQVAASLRAADAGAPPVGGGIDLRADGAGRLDRLRFFAAADGDAGAEVLAWRTDDGWQAHRRARPVRTAHVAAAAVMTDSLFGAGARAGVPNEVMARMANLFLYDVDFVRDVQAGDRFEVVYEARYDEAGRPLGTGDIVFAAMTWRGGREAKGYYRFEDGGPGGGSEAAYFDVDGASAQRLLMKTPIEGARVTSRFGPRRHPTLGYTKAHKGVDFGARSGTPIMAAGDGVVMRAGPLGSYGNFLLIRHANGFETAYAHLRGFAGGVERGARVRQGEVVAYVGSTGRSTGPHLHYEVREDGKAVNPMNLDIATGALLSGEALTDFARVRDEADAMRGLPLAVTAAGD